MEKHFARQSGRTVEQLCANYDNEDGHTEQVTALALRLFDATRRWLKWRAADRRILEAAGRLHDVGYSVDPSRHPEISAEIVLREGVRGFTPSEWADIAGTILLHSGHPDRILAHPLLQGIPERGRILRLGALLRVADALDHSHVQDACIIRVNRAATTIRVVVRSEFFPGNVARADQKADLWRRVQPLDIQFQAARPSGGKTRSLFDSGTGLREAARRLLSLYYKRLLQNAEGVLRGESAEALHDLRVASRRLRAGLQLFRKHLPSGVPERIREDLNRLSKALGPVRDADVWIEFLQSTAAFSRWSARRSWQDFLARQLEFRRGQQPFVQQCLTGPGFAALKRRMGLLLRTDLVRLQRQPAVVDLEDLAAIKLRKAIDQVMAKKRWRHSRSMSKLHAFRIRLRKARYLADFFGPLWGSDVNRLARRLERVEQLFGGIHDTAVLLERSRTAGGEFVRPLAASLVRRRRKSSGKLRRAWKRLIDAVSQRRLRKALKGALAVP